MKVIVTKDEIKLKYLFTTVTVKAGTSLSFNIGPQWVREYFWGRRAGWMIYSSPFFLMVPADRITEGSTVASLTVDKVEVKGLKSLIMGADATKLFFMSYGDLKNFVRQLVEKKFPTKLDLAELERILLKDDHRKFIYSEIGMAYYKDEADHIIKFAGNKNLVWVYGVVGILIALIMIYYYFFG